MSNQTASDICRSGFTERAALSLACAWVDRQAAAVTPEIVPLAEATGRVLADAVEIGDEPPGRARAAENGYAVRAADCDGANPYNPLLLALRRPGLDELVAGSACVIATGWPLPMGADAVLPFEAANPDGARSLEVLAPIAPGTGVERWRLALRSGTVLLERGRRLRPQDVCYLAAIGVNEVSVLRRPRVAIVVPGAKSGPDALTPMLLGLLARDGAVVEPILVGGDDKHALATALSNPRIRNCQLVLLAGRGGAGLDDTAAGGVELAGGDLALHGLALRPGGSSAVGTLPTWEDPGMPGSIPIMLLPGEPFACLVAFDMLASPLVRRLAGADPALPYPVAAYELARKITAGIGWVEVVPVKLAGRQAQPIGADAGLAGAVLADGFVVVTEASEGHPAGARVHVHLYDSQATGQP